MGVRGAALLTAALTLVGAVLGLARDVVIAAVFGAGPAVDAFLVAQGLMNLVLGLVAGAMAKAAVPVVARAAEEGRAPAGMASIRAALGLSCAVLIAGGVAMWMGAGGVVAVLAPGFDDSTSIVATELTRIVLVASLLVCATNILAGAGQALGRFAPAALQGVGFNLVMLAAAGIAGPVFGVHALAWGFVLGSAVRLLIQLPGVRSAGVRPWPSLRWRDPGLAEMLRLLPAMLVGSAVSNVNTLVDRAVASTVSDGAIAAVNFAARLVATVDMLFIATLLAALYPRLAAAATPERRAELRVLIDRGIGVLVAVLVPVGVTLAVVATPAVRLVFGRGAFDQVAVATTASVLGVLAVGLPVLAMREVCARAAYALGDGGIAVRSALVAMTVNVVGDLALAPLLGVVGIAIATVASGVAGAAVALYGLHRGYRVVARMTGPVLGSVAAGLAALLPALGVRGLLTGALAGVPGDLLVVTASGLAVVAVYLPALRLLAAPHFRLLADVPGWWYSRRKR